MAKSKKIAKEAVSSVANAGIVLNDEYIYCDLSSSRFGAKFPK